MMRIFVLGVFLLAGCAPNITETNFFQEHPEDTNLEEMPIQLGIIRDGNLTITLTAPDSLQVGTRKVWLEATMDGAPLSSGSFTLLPRWIAGTQIILSPLGETNLVPTDRSGYFEGTQHLYPRMAKRGAGNLKLPTKQEESLVR